MRRFCVLIDFRFSKTAQGNIGRLFLLERGIQKLHGVLVAEFVRPGPKRAVA